MADEAANSLRTFHDGHQQRGLAELRTSAGWPLGVPPEDGLPDLVQHASLALAGLQTEMRHLDDAVQAISESIRAAQEASLGNSRAPFFLFPANNPATPANINNS